MNIFGHQYNKQRGNESEHKPPEATPHQPAAAVPAAQSITICLAATPAANNPWLEPSNPFGFLLLVLTQPLQAPAKLWADCAGTAGLPESALQWQNLPLLSSASDKSCPGGDRPQERSTSLHSQLQQSTWLQRLSQKTMLHVQTGSEPLVRHLNCRVVGQVFSLLFLFLGNLGLQAE